MPRQIVIQDVLSGPSFWRVQCLDAATGEGLSTGNSDHSRYHAVVIAKGFLEMDPFGCGGDSFTYLDLSLNHLEVA